jgi:N-acetylmuramoyl-L-alanine amidase
MKKIITNILSAGISMTIVTGLVALWMMAPPEVNEADKNCLAMNIYHEARGESAEGQIAVAMVTLNRVAHTNWPDNICDVVYEHKQFSWTWTMVDHTPHEQTAWNIANVIARDVMIGNVTDVTNGAVFYHASYVNPSWLDYVDLSKVIGSHLFYTWDGNWELENE